MPRAKTCDVLISPDVEDVGFRNVTFDEMVFELNYLPLSRDSLTYGLILLRLSRGNERQ